MTKNELPGNRVAYTSGEVAGEGSLDRNQQLTEISLPQLTSTRIQSHQYVYETTKVGQWGFLTARSQKEYINVYCINLFLLGCSKLRGKCTFDRRTR